MVQKLILARKAVVSADIAVVNNTDVAFEWATDDNNDPIPKGCRITGVSLISHDGADPPVAVSTVFRLRFYTKRTLLLSGQRYEDSRYGDGAENVKLFDKTEWDYHNGDNVGAINGTIGIENGENDATFTLAIDFEREY